MWLRVFFAFALAVSGVSTVACVANVLQWPPVLPEAATQAYREGNYILAANLAEAAGSSVALAFAARARNADAVTREKGLCLDCLIKAEATAQAAILASNARQASLAQSNFHKPALAQAYVQLAVAIGLRGRLLDASEAQAEGLAERGRAAIDRALELDPQDAWARASLGGWHLEIVRRGGPVLASVMYGASEREGLKNLRSAVAQNPANLLLSYHFALSILALDPERFRAEALSALKSGQIDTTADAMTAFTRKRSGKLVELLKTGTPDEIEALVRNYQGYPPET